MPLFRRSQSIPNGYPPAPEGTIIYAIGDIHGRLDLLNAVMGAIDDDAKAHAGLRHLEIYLGDYLDRGPHSAGVLDRLIGRAERHDVVTLRGNHEVAFCDVMAGEMDVAAWSTYGATETLRSYGIDPQQSDSTIRASLRERVPPRHKQFLDNLSPYHLEGSYAFVHAGIRPGIAWAEQDEDDLFWIRREFLDFDGDLGHLVVHGHTPVDRPEFKINRINIDTRAYSSGQLTCLKIDADGPSLLN